MTDLPEKLLGIDLEPDEEADEDDEEPRDRFVVVRCGQHELAIPVEAVRTIAEWPAATAPVPRTGEAIEGVTDVRGAITVVVDPRPHFPDAEPPDGDGELVVLDRPADRQGAALRVDEVRGVESVPASNVREPGDETDPDAVGSATDHPLVVGVVEVERRRRTGADRVLAPAGGESNRESGTTDGPAGADPSTPDSGPIVVRPTPILDVESLLLVSGEPS